MVHGTLGLPTGLPRPGWYGDPERPGMLRWWDGALWTDARTSRPTELPEAGWYLDPEQPATLRWWDGTAWTGARTPVPSAPQHAGPAPHARLLSSDPGRPQNPTEARVAEIMRDGVASAKRWYPAYAVAFLMSAAFVGLGLLLWMHRAADDPRPNPFVSTLAPSLGSIGVTGGLVVLACLLTSAAVQSWRMWGLVSALPDDGSVGPGEVQSRVYDATWRLRAWCGIVVWLVVFVTMARLAATTASAPSDQAGLGLAFGIVAFVALAMALATVRQWHYQGRPWDAPRLSTPVAWPGSAPRRSSSTGLVRAAPVIRVRAPGGRGRPIGWDGNDVASQASYAQNGLVLTDSALVAVTVSVAEQDCLPLASRTYSDVAMGLFMSGIAIREAVEQRLGSISARTPATTDDLTLPRAGISRLVVQGAELTVELTDGAALSFLFNHANSAIVFATQASAHGVAVTWSDQPSADMALAGTVPFAVGGGAMWSATGTVVSTTRTTSLLPNAPAWLMPRPYPRTSRSTGRDGRFGITLYRADEMTPRLRRRMGRTF